MKRKYWFFIFFLFYGSRSFLEFPIFILNLSYSNICWIKTKRKKFIFISAVLIQQIFEYDKFSIKIGNSMIIGLRKWFERRGGRESEEWACEGEEKGGA